jgi:hypothetical protein
MNPAIPVIAQDAARNPVPDPAGYGWPDVAVLVLVLLTFVILFGEEIVNAIRDRIRRG